MKTRCLWAQGDPLLKDYHDAEWGVPVHDDRKLFEFLILEGAQAGLSWLTVLGKRDNYRRVFDNFDVQKIALYNQIKIDQLITYKGIIRNRKKILATIKNAQAVLEIMKEYGSLDTYIWRFVQRQPRKNAWEQLTEIPSWTKESYQMSQALKKRGFSFVGPTICYAFMQAVGMVNDHTVDCFRYAQIS